MEPATEIDPTEIEELSLRDWLASFALVGLLSNQGVDYGDARAVQRTAREAYSFADAMMKARAKPSV